MSWDIFQLICNRATQFLTPGTLTIGDHMHEKNFGVFFSQISFSFLLTNKCTQQWPVVSEKLIIMAHVWLNYGDHPLYSFRIKIIDKIYFNYYFISVFAPDHNFELLGEDEIQFILKSIKNCCTDHI